MQTRNLIAGVVACAALGTGAGIAAEQALEGADNDTRTVEFKDRDGKRVGEATLTETPNGVLIDATLDGLEPGWHAFHVHERGKCDVPDFKSAGGHHDPHGNKHGFKVASGAHAGDMHNIHVDDDGKAQIEALADGVTLKEGKAALMDSDGSALMVHAGADDYHSQPSGDAGNRVACAEISRAD